jgi:acetylornithine deacetylase
LTPEIGEAKALLAKLVGFDTTSSKSNLAIIDFIKSHLEGLAIASMIVPSDDGNKANLYATIGESGDKGVGLSGHTDCVPVTGQSWDSDPFGLVEKNGRLYGRGTCDMKGYLACMLAAVPAFKAAKLKTPIHLIFSYDEEVGCDGAKKLAAAMGRSIPRPEIVLVGEPTNMTVVDAHKGGSRFITRVRGRDAHSSMPQLGVNAIVAAARLIGELQRYGDELARSRTLPRFNPPGSTLQVGRIEGGIADNVVPQHCWFTWGIRMLPGYDPLDMKSKLTAFAEREVLPGMRAASPDCEITTELAGFIPAFDSGKGSAATSLALKLAGQNETFAVSYGTEAGFFQAAGPSTVICGPGSIDQAHKPNEFVEVVEIEKCLAFMGRLADWAAAPQ